MKLFGVPFSAHTRKVRLALAEKKIDYSLVPVAPIAPSGTPLAPPENWRDLSPTGKIPVLEDGDFILADSSAICAYLEKRYPQTAIYPESARDYGRALWLEEYVDGDLQQHILHGFLLEVIAPALLNREPNQDVMSHSLNVEIPKRFSYLEDQIADPLQCLVDGQFTVADITLISILINFSYGGQRVDAKKYPKLSAYFKHMLTYETVQKVLREESETVRGIPVLDATFLDEALTQPAAAEV